MLVQLPTSNPISFLSIKSSGQTALCVSTARIAGLLLRILFCHNPLLLIAGWPARSPTARNFLTRPPTSTPRRAISPSEGLPNFPTLPQGE